MKLVMYAVLICSVWCVVQAQTGGTLRANFQLDAQQYSQDTIIKAEQPPEKVSSMGFLSLIYSYDKFEAGMRYEGFFNPLVGIDPKYTGSGIPFRYAMYRNDEVEATVGNFYEQFGSGMILRLYQDWALGVDNSIDGLRIKATPLNGLQLTGVVGKQRSYFSLGPGIVRGVDADINLNEMDIFGQGWLGEDVQVRLGASGVSKYQPSSDPLLKIPLNVFAYSTRARVSSGGFNVYGEWAYKINDPSEANSKSFNPGNGLYVSAAYSGTGLGVNLIFKRIDNMDFRSDRAAAINSLTLSFLPALTKQHTYRLATMFPYATQPNGEIGLQGEVVYTFPKNSFLGGKYGTTVTVNYANLHNLDSTLTDTSVNRFTYESKFFAFGKTLLFNDLNIEVSHIWSKSFKSTVMFATQSYQRDIIEGKNEYGLIHPTIAVLEGTYTINSTNALRCELQHLGVSADSVKADKNNWAFGLLEYTYNSNWYFTVFDEWNYGNHNEQEKIHYYSGAVAFVKNTTRVSFGYGRQRAGILCVGGVCRVVPAANGLTLSVTSSF